MKSTQELIEHASDITDDILRTLDLRDGVDVEGEKIYKKIIQDDTMWVMLVVGVKNA